MVYVRFVVNINKMEMRYLFINSYKTKELYDVCNRFQYKLGDYAGYISDLLMLFRDCQSIVPSTPAKIIDDIRVEQEGCIERCIQILSEHLNRSKYLLRSVNRYINQCIKSIDNEEMLNFIVVQTKELISDLSEQFPSSSDMMYLRDMLIDCKKEIDYLCSQRWQGGKSCIGIESIDDLENKYMKQCAQSVQEVKHILENYMYQLAEAQRDISMVCVYASPEIMKDISSKPINEQKYPYFHSFSDDEDVFMEEIYGSPQMISDYQHSLDRKSVV